MGLCESVVFGCSGGFEALCYRIGEKAESQMAPRTRRSLISPAVLYPVRMKNKPKRCGAEEKVTKVSTSSVRDKTFPSTNVMSGCLTFFLINNTCNTTEHPWTTRPIHWNPPTPVHPVLPYLKAITLSASSGTTLPKLHQAINHTQSTLKTD